MTTITDLPPELVSQIVESLVDSEIDTLSMPKIGDNALWEPNKEFSDAEMRSEWVTPLDVTSPFYPPIKSLRK